MGSDLYKTKSILRKSIKDEQAMLRKYTHSVKLLKSGKKVQNMSLSNAKRTVEALKQVLINKKKILHNWK